MSQFDIIIRGGKIIDGLGNAPIFSDLAISEDKIDLINCSNHIRLIEWLLYYSCFRLHRNIVRVIHKKAPKIDPNSQLADVITLVLVDGEVVEVEPRPVVSVMVISGRRLGLHLSSIRK